MLLIVILLAGANACSKSTSASEGGKKDPGANFVLDPFVLNLSNHGNEGALKISVVLDLSKAVLVEKAKTKTPQLRDAIIMVLSTQSKEDLATQEGKAQLKEEILAQANQILNEGSVRNVYFPDFVMQ